MARPPSNQPTEFELQVLSILWEHGPSTTRQIHNRIKETRAAIYATTVKMLAIMFDKSLVRRDDSIRPQIYRAAVNQRRTQGRMLKDLVRRAYYGSTKSLIMQALSEQKPSAGELQEIRKLIDELDADKP